MEKLRVAMVGAGRAGAVHAANLVGDAPEAEVTAIIDGDAGVAEGLANKIGVGTCYATLEAALQDGGFDAVVVSTPTFTHRDLVMTAAEAGKHIFCEKPMALTAEECDDMISAAERARVVLQIGFMRRFQPEFVEARRRLVAGDVGEPMVVKSLTRGPGLPPAWAWDLEASNGMLAEVNSHDFDCVRWLVDSDIERVYAETANHKGAERGIESRDFYDNAVVSLRFACGAIGTIDGTCPADYGYDARVELLGSEGLLVVGDMRGQPVVQVRNGEQEATVPVHRSWADRFEQGYRDEIRSFVGAALGGGPPAVTGEDGRHAVRAVVAANRSWREGRPISLEEGT